LIERNNVINGKKENMFSEFKNTILSDNLKYRQGGLVSNRSNIAAFALCIASPPPSL
jgi:hypothetical protein